MFKLKLSARDWLYILVAIVTCGVAWGTVTAKQMAQEDKILKLVSVPENLAVLSERMSSIDKKTTETQRDVREIREYLFTKDRHASESHFSR